MYDRLLDLVRMFRSLEIDVRELALVKNCFIAKDKVTPLTQVPIATFKEAVIGKLKHHHEVDDIVEKLCDILKVEVEVDGVK